MSAVNAVIERMRQQRNKPAIFWKGKILTYADIIRLIDEWTERLDYVHIAAGTTCGVFGDYSPSACSLFFALMQRQAIIVPFTQEIQSEMPNLSIIAGIEQMISFDSNDDYSILRISEPEIPPLVSSFRQRKHPGLIVFTSGSTGQPKGILQDCELVMKKFLVERQSWRTILFLLMDHFGGFNTLLSTFAYGGMGVCLPKRTPTDVCLAIQQSSAELLPTTPTFLNFLLASQDYKNYDLSSIKLITYGTELMPSATLEKIHRVFPNARLKQTYGLSEVGVLRSKSREDNSVWVKIGGNGFETKVVDGILWVKSESNMVGYLNAPDPVNEEGFMCTGDQVEVDGEYIRFLGRASEIINVGGKKVFPSEVESVLLEAENISEATVYGEKHPLLGQVPYARISIAKDEGEDELRERLRKHCSGRLAKFKIPMRFIIIPKDDQHTLRLKKKRIGL